MFEKNFNRKTVHPRILVVPLDWGLGHATRCIPIIKELLNNDCEVLIGAEGPQRFLLQKEFPLLACLPVPVYNMWYSRRKSFFILTILFQLPKLFLAIYKEHAWLKKVVKEERIDAVISDNRFGLYHATIPAAYITHQLLIKTGNPFIEKITQQLHYRFIKKYTACWVPDVEKEPSLGGTLSHPHKLPPTVKYLGCLSRFEKISRIEKKYDLLILLSGPEPQRTLFEQLLLEQLPAFKGKVLFVRGLPADQILDKEQNDNLQIVNHLPSSELNIAIQQSELVISRSGYTTVMDLVKLQHKAIMVATPGQTEQEYLSKHLTEQKLFYSTDQDSFLLEDVIKQAEKESFAIPLYDMEQYKKVIVDFTGPL
jgi:predicted glycosyltransferase